MPNFDDMRDDSSLSEEDLQLTYKAREWALNNSLSRMIVRDGAEHLVVQFMDRVKKLSREKERLEFILGTTIGKLDDPTLSYEQRMLLKQFHQFLRSEDAAGVANFDPENTDAAIDTFAQRLREDDDEDMEETSIRNLRSEDIRRAFNLPEDAQMNFIGDESDGRGLYYTPGHVQVTITRAKSGEE